MMMCSILFKRSIRIRLCVSLSKGGVDMMNGYWMDEVAEFIRLFPSFFFTQIYFHTHDKSVFLIKY